MADAKTKVETPVTPEMIAAGWACLRRAHLPRLGPGDGLVEAYRAMLAAAPQPAVSDVPHDVVRALAALALEQAKVRFLQSKLPICGCDGAYDDGCFKCDTDKLKSQALATPAPSTSTEEALRAENARLIEAAQALLDAETVTVHVGYDEAAGGGNFVWADAIRTDDEAFTKLRTALSR